MKLELHEWFLDHALEDMEESMNGTYGNYDDDFDEDYAVLLRQWNKVQMLKNKRETP